MAPVFFILGVNIPVTHLAHTLDIDKYSCEIVSTVSIDKPVFRTILNVTSPI